MASIDQAPGLLQRLAEVAERHGMTRVRVEQSGMIVEFERVPVSAPLADPPPNPLTGSPYGDAMARLMRPETEETDDGSAT